MSSSEWRRWLWGLGLVLCAACGPGPGPEHDPRPARVLPSEGVNTGPVAVVIEGENFLALATQHLGGGAPVEVHSDFEARLGDTPLEGVVLEDERRLRAVVPRGLAVGWHALTVVSPLGRSVVLPEAYFSSDRTLSRLEARAVLAPPSMVVGEEARFVFEVANRGETAALGVEPKLDVVGGVTVVAAPGAVDVGPGQQVSFSWTLRAEAPGEVRLSPGARGRDATLARSVEVGGVPVFLPLLRPAALEARVVLGAEQVSVGQEVSVGLEVRNTGESVARAVRPLASVSGGASPLLLPEPGDLLPGERRFFSWRYRADAAGPVVFTLSATGTEAATGAALRVGPLASPSLAVQRPAALFATLVAPTHVSVGERMDVSLEVSNTGEATAQVVTPVLAVPPALEVVSQPAPASVGGGARRVFTWSVRAHDPGSVVLVARATGADANSGEGLATPFLIRHVTVRMGGQ